MRYLLLAVLFLSPCVFVQAQTFSKTDWYSESSTNGIIIQNSFPRGGRYNGPTKKNFNYSHLVFFTRVVNETTTPIELTVYFSADSIAIPNSPGTFVKLFLPSDTMTYERRSVFDYGVKALKSFDEPTRFQRTIIPKDECLFLVEALFYQTMATLENRSRGGNRAELVLKGQDLFYRMPPQIDLLPCGQVVSRK